MKRLFLISICLLFIHNVQAQNPGLLGKHFVLHYNFDHHIGSYNYSPYNPDDPSIFNIVTGVIQARHEGELECVLSRRHSFNVNFAYFRGGDRKELINYNTKEIGVSFKSYNVGSQNSSIAPLGTYVKPKVFLLMSKYTPLNPNAGSLTEITNFRHYGVSMELGRQSVIFKKLILDLGFTFGWVFTNRKEIGIFNNDSEGGSPFTQVFLNSPYKYLLLNRALSFKVGIGFPLF